MADKSQTETELQIALEKNAELEKELEKAKNAKSGKVKFKNFSGSLLDEVKEELGKLDRVWADMPVEAERGVRRIREAVDHIKNNYREAPGE